MKKVIFLVGIIILGISCKKDPVVTPTPSTCNCYEYHEKKTFAPSGVTWEFNYQTQPQPDLCAKATGEWIYDDASTLCSIRHKIICN